MIGKLIVHAESLHFRSVLSTTLHTTVSVEHLQSKADCLSDVVEMRSNLARAIGRNALIMPPPTFPIIQKRFAATVLQKPKIVDLSRELYHRCLNHPFHVPFVRPSLVESL